MSAKTAISVEEFDRVMRIARIQAIEPGQDIEGAPDLAIEVLSPSDTAAAMRRKVKQYLKAGGELIYIYSGTSMPSTARVRSSWARK